MKIYRVFPKFTLLSLLVVFVPLIISCSVTKKTLSPEDEADITVEKVFELLQKYNVLAEKVAADSEITADEALALNKMTSEINKMGDAFDQKHNDPKLLEDAMGRLGEKPKYADILSKLLDVSMRLYGCKGFELLEN